MKKSEDTKLISVTFLSNDILEMNDLLDHFGGNWTAEGNYLTGTFSKADYKKIKEKLKKELDVEIISAVDYKYSPPASETRSNVIITGMVNSGNRFKNQTKQNINDNLFFEKYLNSEEIESALCYYRVNNRDLLKIHKLPEKTFNGKVCNFITLGNRNSKLNKIGVYLISGLHSREWHPPDALIYFIKKICEHYKNGKNLIIGQNVFTVEQIKKIVDNLEIYIFPLVNPDGREFSQNSKSEIDLKWRKNRREFSNNLFGVDINRNFDFMWDFEKYLCPKTADFSHMSKFTLNDNYIGPYPESEPETRNIISIIRNKKKLKYFLDIHSYEFNANNILYSWSHSKSQTVRPDINFKNTVYWGNHGSDFYSEFVEKEDFELRRKFAAKMALAATKASSYKRKYIAKTSYNMYLITGGSRDYMESRYIINPFTQGKIHSFFMEASALSFFPSIDERKIIIKEICSSLFEFCIQILNKECV